MIANQTFPLASKQLSRWQKSFEKAAASSKFRKFLMNQVRVDNKKPTASHAAEIVDLVRSDLVSMDERMLEYALGWEFASYKHLQAGVYLQIADFARFHPDELVVELGVGCGNLFATLGRPKLLGIDINPYALELAHSRLAGIGLMPTIYPDSEVLVNPFFGLSLTPVPIRDKLNLDGVNLVCDNILTFANTVEILKSNGVKADCIVFILFGGRSLHTTIELVERNPSTDLHETERILRDGSKICRKGGRIIFGIRQISLDPKELSLTSVQPFNSDALFRKYRSQVTLHRQTSIDLIREDSRSGIAISVPSLNPQVLPESAHAYKLLLIEAIVK